MLLNALLGQRRIRPQNSERLWDKGVALYLSSVIFTSNSSQTWFFFLVGSFCCFFCLVCLFVFVKFLCFGNTGLLNMVLLNFVWEQKGKRRPPAGLPMLRRLRQPKGHLLSSVCCSLFSFHIFLSCFVSFCQWIVPALFSRGCWSSCNGFVREGKASFTPLKPILFPLHPVQGWT